MYIKYYMKNYLNLKRLICWKKAHKYINLLLLTKFSKHLFKNGVKLELCTSVFLLNSRPHVCQLYGILATKDTDNFIKNLWNWFELWNGNMTILTSYASLFWYLVPLLSHKGKVYYHEVICKSWILCQVNTNYSSHIKNDCNWQLWREC